MNRTSLGTGLIFSALTAVLPSCGDSNDKCKDGSNSDNCGVCEVACLQGETCIDGACVQTCFEPSKQCGATCVDVQTSVANCGTCGNACAPYGECSAGKCENPLAVLQTEGFFPTPAGEGERDLDLFMVEDGSLELIKVNGPLLESSQGVVDHVILPNGDILMLATQDTPGVRELYRVSPRGGARTKLNPPLPEGGRIELGLVFSADGSKVLFRANMDENDSDIDLYAVELAKPGAVVKVNGTDDGEVLPGMVISGDGKRAAYLREFNDGKSFRQFAYTVDLSAAAPGEPQQLGENLENVLDMQISENGKRILLRGDDDSLPLRAIDTAVPGTSHRISNSDGGEGNVEAYQLLPDGSAVVYVSTPFFGNNSLWRASLAGADAYESIELVDDETQGSVQRELALSPDGKLAYFRKADPQTDLVRLYRTDATKKGALTRLSNAGDDYTVAVQDFSLSRDGKSIAFRANLPQPEARRKGPGAAGRLPFSSGLPELRFVDLSGATPTASVQLNPAVPEGYEGVSGGYLVTDDRRVLFPADFDEQFMRDIYLVSAATPGTLRKVSPARPPTSDAATVSAMSLFRGAPQ